jgi:hypothetical protein
VVDTGLPLIKIPQKTLANLIFLHRHNVPPVLYKGINNMFKGALQNFNICFSTNFVTFSTKDWEICGNFRFSILNSFKFAKFFGEKKSPNFRYHH